MKIQDSEFKALIADATKYGNIEKSLWNELEEDNMLGEQDDRSWYQKFQPKVTQPEEGVFQRIKEMVSKVKVHFEQVADKELETPAGSQDEATGTRLNKEDKQITSLSKIVRRVMSLVSDHGIALEFLREIFNVQEKKLAEVEEKMSGPGYTPEALDLAVDIKMQEKGIEIENRFKEMEEKINNLENDNAQLRVEKDKLEKEMDETRQRGIKGNLLISAPPKGGQPHPRAKPEPIQGNGRMETVTEMNLRMIKEKTGVEIKLGDITACHVMPGNPHTWVLRVANRAPDSGWESLCAGMYTGKKLGTDTYFDDNGIYINFMVTKSRSKLLQQVREIRKGNKKLLPKFSVNQNGRITVLLKRTPPTPRGQAREKETWEVVEDLKDLRRLFPGLTFPYTAPPQARPGQAAGAQGNNRN